MAKSSVAGNRKPRADAQRNRERLLSVAKAAFMRGDKDVNLDAIAKEAGVGIGTLYRHFPTRDTLIEAIYRTEVDDLSNAAARLSAHHPPVEALRAWMRLFIRHVATKQLFAPALSSMVCGPSELYALSGARMTSAIETLVERAVASRHIRADLEPLDLLRALVGVSSVAASPDWEESANRLVDILIAGSKPAA